MTPKLAHNSLDLSLDPDTSNQMAGRLSERENWRLQAASLSREILGVILEASDLQPSTLTHEKRE
jgi:hypothetical protein